jgi:molybdopterin-guanine dinucleotide biosynthesis protein A
MGRDKGLITTDNGNWTQKMLDNFKKLGIPTLLSINRTQFDQYQSAFPQIELICDNDSLQIKGPLAALLSVHLNYPMEDFFVTACDMPLMNEVVLEELFTIYSNEPGHDCYVFTNQGEPEPLCGIYSAKGLAAVMAMYDRAELLKHSMKFMLDHLSTILVPIPESWKIYFRNINTHGDLNRL